MIGIVGVSIVITEVITVSDNIPLNHNTLLAFFTVSATALLKANPFSKPPGLCVALQLGFLKIIAAERDGDVFLVVFVHACDAFD
jgi:hypothetical protein